MVKVIQGSITDVECDVAVVNLFRGVKHPGGATGAMDRVLGGAITRAISAFDGDLGESIVLETKGKIGVDKVTVIGLGISSQFGYTEVEIASYAAAKKGVELGCKSIATIIHGAGIGGLDPVQAAQKVVAGSVRAFEEMEANDAELLIVEFNASKAKEIEKALS
jgi:leucyl aminopeptidase